MKRIFILLFGLLLGLSTFGQAIVVFKYINEGDIGCAEFSVSETKKIHFVKGNLMYQPSSKTWKIAERQYDFVGGNNGTSTVPNGRHGTIWANGIQCSNTTKNHVRGYDGWIDVFAWGASGWYGDDDGEDDTKSYTWRLSHNSKQKITVNPYDLSGKKDSVCLILGGDEYQGLIGDYEHADWGIRNNETLGGTTDSVFRTPTKKEFDYLLTERVNAKKLSIRGHIRINGNNGAPDTIVNGLILLPDDWSPIILPEKTIISDEDGNEFYETNEFTEAEWVILEENGAIFLPATGGTSRFNRSGFYWTSSSHKNLSAWNVEFGGYGWNGHESDPQTKAADKFSGRAVRLVMDVIVRDTIDTTTLKHDCNQYKKTYIPGQGGSISVVNKDSDSCFWLLKAHPDTGYKFAHWINFTGGKSYLDSTELHIDTTIGKIAMQAFFVKKDARIYRWSGDSVVYITDTTDVLVNNNHGYSTTVIGNDVMDNTLYKSDYGVWKEHIHNEILNNVYAGKQCRLILCGNNTRATAAIDTIIPANVKGDSLASEMNLNQYERVDVHVYNGGVLTIDVNTTINGVLDIHEGGKVIVPTDRTLEVNGIIMRGNGITKEWPQLVADGSIINHNNDTIYYDYTLNQHYYYPLAVPYTVYCSDVYNPISGRGASYQSYYYDTDKRSIGNYGWTEYDDTKTGAHFEPGKGYIVYAYPIKWKGTRQKAAVMRFPMKADLRYGEDEKVINIRCSETYNNIVNKNWNLIGNPYLANLTPTHSPVNYVTYSVDGYISYEQDFMDGFTMSPFNCYFIQAEEGETIVFDVADRVMARRGPVIDFDKYSFGIIFTQNEQEEHTGFLFGDYTTTYEINADLNKEFGNDATFSIYAISDNGKMAFIASPKEMLEAPIPIGYHNAQCAPTKISFDKMRYNKPEIDKLLLIDIEANIYTDLLTDDYYFIPNKSSSDTRFYLVAKMVDENSNTTTGIGNISSDDERPVYNIFGYTIKNARIMPNIFYIFVDRSGNYKKKIYVK